MTTQARTSTTPSRVAGFAQQPLLVLVLSVFLLLLTVLLATGIGSISVSFAEVFESLFLCNQQGDNCGVSSVVHKIIWEIRLPRVLMALMTGAGLAITGAVLQAVTRNPLADPYLFGISSGASLGAVIVMAVVSSAVVSVTVGALIGGAFSVMLMLTLAGRSAVQVERLLLAGVAVSFMLSSFTSLILYYSEPDTAATLLFWMMGSFSNSQWAELWMPAVAVISGTMIFIIFRRWFSALQAGEECAHTLGIPVNRFRLSMLIVCASVTAVLVAHVGGIGFVGLMIPHICRFLVGTSMHRVLFMCLFLGGSFMVWVDVMARTLLHNQVLPIGIVTSAMGSFFFFFILKYRSTEE